ncbi:hypothetical protein E0V34_15415 [Escherichia coli]|uniref:hypothetical protein n=1 Tax=Escherichia coli TaxID=562 RepID=UPI000BDF7B4C|nr:hypothetical protein [Escherichia coli]EGO8353323.1 hypothetical protein [Escherichia coli]EHD3419951.1 hypothetical protein [Escherichia coli O167]CAD7363226.1 Uncharacterised protein [Escherichia coli]HBD0239862.1 hypothetical protein [Escherichia coli]
MIDIAELLNAEKNNFISLRELIERIKLSQPKATTSQIVSFLYQTRQKLPEWVKWDEMMGIEQTSENPFDGDWSLSEVLEGILRLGFVPEVEDSVPLAIDDSDDIPY